MLSDPIILDDLPENIDPAKKIQKIEEKYDLDDWTTDNKKRTILECQVEKMQYSKHFWFHRNNEYVFPWQIYWVSLYNNQIKNKKNTLAK